MSGAKREPSSSVKKATAIGRAGCATPCCSSVSTTSSPASTPRLPSKRPPGGDGVDVRAAHHRAPRRVGAGPGGHDVADGVDASRRGRGRASTPTTRSRPVAVGVGQGQAGAPLARRSGPRSRRPRPSSTRPAHRRVAVDSDVGARVVSVTAYRWRNAAISRQRGAERARRRRRTAAGAALGRRRRRVADVAVVGRSRWTASRTTPRRRSGRSWLPARCSGTAATAAGHVDQLGRQVQHQRRLVECRRGCPCRARRRGDDAALVGGQAGVGEERHQAVVQAQLAVGDVHEGAVAAVPVEEHEALAPASSPTQRPRSSSTASSVDADSQTVPGDQACSLDFVYARGGSSQTSSSSPTARPRPRRRARR